MTSSTKNPLAHQFSKIALNSVFGAFANAIANSFEDKGKFKFVDQKTIDGNLWYTVQIFDVDVWFWLSQQSGSWNHHLSENHGIYVADMEESLFLALTLKFL